MGFLEREKQQGMAVIIGFVLVGLFLAFSGGILVGWAFLTSPETTTTSTTTTTTTESTTTTTLEVVTSTTFPDTTTTTLPVPATTTTTLPSFRVDSNGNLLPEDAERLIQLAMERLEGSTTTTTIKRRISSAAMYNLYNPSNMDSYGLGQYWVNKSIITRLHTVDGSDKWSESTTYKLFNVEQAEARAYLKDWVEGDETVEGVYRGEPNGNLKKIVREDYFVNFYMGN